jgi:Amidohydrolase family
VFKGLGSCCLILAVTSTPAELAGLSHRIGYIKSGHDADLVIWDSHPLALGATPNQVFIDGIPQLSKPFVLQKPPGFQTVPKTPDFEKEASDTVRYDGLPPLKPTKRTDSAVTFVNVQSMWTKGSSGAVESLLVAQNGRPGVVVVRGGAIQCFGGATQCITSEQGDIIDLHGGSISPGLVSFGSGLGLVEIPPEVSTSDGYILDPISDKVPSLLKDVEIRAVDGLVFDGRNVL